MTKAALCGWQRSRDGKDEVAELDVYRKGKKMTYKRRDWHFWHAAPGTAIVATLAMVGGFLALSISPASAATTTTATTDTTTTTTRRHPPRPRPRCLVRIVPLR